MEKRKTIMKKKIIALLLGTALLTASLTGCGASESEDKNIVVGASVTPHSEILEIARPLIEEAGYTLEIVEFTDYVLPNTALDEGDLDANFFQHLPYLEEFNAEKGTEIVSVADVHFEPFGIYGGKVTDLAEIQEGSTVAVPNDTTNEARALLLLEAEGFITLAEDAGLTATVLDIVENPLNLEIVEIEAAQLVRTLEDVDIACINGNYALEGGLSVADALATESEESLAAETFANIIAIQAGAEDDEKTQVLIEAVLSDEVRTYIEETYEGAVVPVF